MAERLQHPHARRRSVEGCSHWRQGVSRLIDASLVLQRYSRLAYACNWRPDSSGAMPEIGEITIFQATANLRGPTG
jgi:predicted N-formylglutamate amidohydrolase